MTQVSPSRRWIMLALMTTMMLAAMDATVVATVIPNLVADLGGFSSFTWVFSIYLLVQAVLIPIYGKLADQYGRKPILLYGIGVFVLGSCACAAAWDMPSLVFFRALQAIGAGAIVATVNTVAGDLFSIEERARIQGWLSSVWAFSAISGPALGGLMVEWASWRWIFFINLPLGALAFVLIAYFLKEDRLSQPHQVDYWGAVFIALTLTSLIFFLLQGGSAWAWFSLPSAGLLLAILLLGWLTLRIERRASEPIIPMWLWHHRAFLGSNLAMIVMGIVLMAPMAYLPMFVQTVHGLGTAASGFVLAAMSLGWPLASSFSGRLYLRIGFRNTALIGGALQIFAVGLFLLTALHASIWMLVVNQFILGIGFGLMSTPLLVGAQSIVDWSRRGVVTSANMFSRYLGQTLGAAILGALFNAQLAYSLMEWPASLPPMDFGVNQVVDVLSNPLVDVSAIDYLREMIALSTAKLYLGVLFFAIVCWLCAGLTPRHYQFLEEEEYR